jgi:hypothetical protein
MELGHSLHERIGVIADNAWANRLHRQVDGHMSRYRWLTNSTQERGTKRSTSIVPSLLPSQPARPAGLEQLPAVMSSLRETRPFASCPLENSDRATASEGTW